MYPFEVIDTVFSHKGGCKVAQVAEVSYFEPRRKELYPAQSCSCWDIKCVDEISAG